MSAGTPTKFESEIRRVINYFRDEFDMNYGEAIGVLTIIIHDLLGEVDSSTGTDEQTEGEGS